MLREGPRALFPQPSDALWELDVPHVSPAAALEHIARQLHADTMPVPAKPALPPAPTDGA